MAKKYDEKRKAQRYFYVTPLYYKGLGKYDNLDALSINISSDGIYFQSNLDLPVGHKFLMAFKIPGDQQTLEAKCVVVHRTRSAEEDGFAIGCKIEKVEGMKKNELRHRLLEAFGHNPDRLY